MIETETAQTRIGVVIVTYRAEEFIAACLESLVASDWRRLRIVVVDNASPDGTAAAIRDWATGAIPFAHPADWPAERRPIVVKPLPFAEMDATTARGAALDALGVVTLVHSGGNLGYAGGVNVGLEVLRRHPEISLFWVLNPDSVVDPHCLAAYAEAAARAPHFSLMSGRTLYYERPSVVQSDGGRMRWWMGFGSTVNLGADASTSAPPPPETLDYLAGGNMVASRAFLDRAGLMDSHWFLYMEEVDWAMRRGDLPLAIAPAACIFHRAGATAGSGAAHRLEAPLSVYLSYMNNMRFALRWNRARLPFNYLAALAVIGRRYGLRRAWPQLEAALRGLHGAPPPQAVRAKLSEETWATIASRPLW